MSIMTCAIATHHFPIASCGHAFADSSAAELEPLPHEMIGSPPARVHPSVQTAGHGGLIYDDVDRCLQWGNRNILVAAFQRTRGEDTPPLRLESKSA